MFSLGLILYVFFHFCICLLIFCTDTPESTEDWIKLIFWEINVIFTIIYVLFALLLWVFRRGLVNLFKARIKHCFTTFYAFRHIAQIQRAQIVQNNLTFVKNVL